MTNDKPSNLDALSNAPVPDLPQDVDQVIRSADAILASLPVMSPDDLALGATPAGPGGDGGTPPAPPSLTLPPSGGPTRSISIRIPLHVIEAFQREAARRGLKYQELMKLILDRASPTW